MARIWLDDSLADRPAMLAAGPYALALYIRAACWAKRHSTDGFIPAEALPSLVADFPEREGWGEKMAKRRLWLSKPGGWLIPELSPSREEQIASTREEDPSLFPQQGAPPTTAATEETERSKATSTSVSSPSRKTAADSWRYAPWPSPPALAHLYNVLTPENVPAVETLSPQRNRNAARLLHQFPEQSWWREVFKQYHLSAFLSGRKRPGKGHQTFRADFDWLLATNKDGVENAVRVHDGFFD